MNIGLLGLLFLILVVTSIVGITSWWTLVIPPLIWVILVGVVIAFHEGAWR